MNVVIVSLRESVLSIGCLGLFVVFVVAWFVWSLVVVLLLGLIYGFGLIWVFFRILLFVANSVACVLSCYALYLGFLNLWRVVVCCDLGI